VSITGTPENPAGAFAVLLVIAIILPLSTYIMPSLIIVRLEFIVTILPLRAYCGPSNGSIGILAITYF
jgi:hypothetical protein